MTADELIAALRALGWRDMQMAVLVDGERTFRRILVAPAGADR